MNENDLNRAIVATIQDTAIPHVDRAVAVELFGAEQGDAVADRVTALVREAVAMPIEWGTMSLADGVRDIMTRFHERHPDLSPEALHEIGRCVGWQLR